MKILTVDDSAIIRRIIGSVAETLGYEILEAENGAIAMEVLEANHQDIHLIVLDWNMPVKDGYETLVDVKKDERFASIPVMMATTESERTNIIKAIQAGAKHYVTKPFNQEDLMTRVAECIA